MQNQDIEYPNLFNIELDSSKGSSFGSLDFLKSKGYEKTYFTSFMAPGLVALFKFNELYFDFIQKTYIKDFGSYKILLFVSNSKIKKSTPSYYISARILLNKDDKLITHNKKNVPTVILYTELNNSFINSVGYYAFFENYYYFVDIVDVDDNLSSYNFSFRNYKHELIATATQHHSDLKSIKLSNTSFIINGNPYNSSLLLELDSSLNDYSFLQLLEYYSSISKENFELLSILSI